MYSLSHLVAFLAFLKSVFGNPELKLYSDGPVVLDATISFKAQLVGASDYEPPFYFTWSKY